MFPDYVSSGQRTMLCYQITDKFDILSGRNRVGTRKGTAPHSTISSHNTYRNLRFDVSEFKTGGAAEEERKL